MICCMGAKTRCHLRTQLNWFRHITHQNELGEELHNEINYSIIFTVRLTANDIFFTVFEGNAYALGVNEDITSPSTVKSETEKIRDRSTYMFDEKTSKLRSEPIESASLPECKRSTSTTLPILLCFHRTTSLILQTVSIIKMVLLWIHLKESRLTQSQYKVPWREERRKHHLRV